MTETVFNFLFWLSIISLITLGVTGFIGYWKTNR